MKKIYFLKTCDTCKRILKQLNTTDFILQDIKSTPITVAQLEEMHQRAKTYEALFSRRAKKYKEMALKDRLLTEIDYKQLILEHYTFLKRPVIIDGDTIFIGSSKKVVEALVENYRKLL